MNVIHYQADHLLKLELQNEQFGLRGIITQQMAEILAQQPAITVADGDGTILMCGGVSTPWPNRAILWACVSVKAGARMLALHRAAKPVLDRQPYKRIETTVRTDFEQGHRWARMMGFQMEAARMECYGPDGQDYSLYARVRE